MTCSTKCAAVSPMRRRAYLDQWIHGRDVIVDWHKRDQYGRLVGVVIAFGHDVNLGLVRAGLAWWYRAYAREQRPEDPKVDEWAEEEAQRERWGLWVEPNPVPSWEWRADQKGK